MVKTQIVCFIIILFIGIVYSAANNRKSKASFCFATLLICSALQLVFDILSVYTVNHLETVPPMVNRVVQRLL